MSERSDHLRINLFGYDLLGPSGKEGIRYAWALNNNWNNYIESAAFNKRSMINITETDKTISAYTTSVSSGCVLKSTGIQCRFCRTGRLLPFGGFLSDAEIAVQNITMVLADISCSNIKNIRANKREFAYMGQGEPGYSYAQIRSAIRITNLAMERMSQTVYRHIIATSGVPEMINELTTDIEAGFFGDSRLTMHFSLHRINNRKLLMPIEQIYPYQRIIQALSRLSQATNDKPCIGVLLLRNFSTKGLPSFTNDEKEMEKIADLLDPELHRVSLCEYNESIEVGCNDPIDDKEANIFLNVFKEKGIEAKLFASFGKSQGAACGLFGGKEPSFQIGATLKNHYETAKEIVSDIMSKEYK